MSQPLSINQTFDTSLVDVQRSFSSTETDTSGSSAKENAPPTPQTKQRPPSPYKTVPTDVLYTQWASTYDTDGNVLQAADDIQMNDLLPEFVRLTNQNWRSIGNREGALKILDFGCGTGRNTVKLIQSPWEAEVDVVGWDGSEAMLELARSKCEAVFNEQRRKVGIELEQFDFTRVENVPDRFESFFDGSISTLVLEHIPIETYFSILAKVLKAGSFALVSNMHADMGNLSQAGYKTPSGERFKATSYAYTVPETVQAAERAGFEVIGSTREMTANETMLDGGVVNEVRIQRGQVAERARKWIGTTIWYGMILRRI